MNTEIQVNSSNIQNILIALVLISAIIYGFIEFRKVNMLPTFTYLQKN